jgi:hypothetical protein
MTVASKNYAPTIAEKDLRVTERVARSAARVAGRSLRIKATGRRRAA